MPSAQPNERHGDEPVFAECTEEFHPVAGCQRLPRRLRQEIVRSSFDPLKESVGGLENEAE